MIPVNTFFRNTFSLLVLFLLTGLLSAQAGVADTAPVTCKKCNILLLNLDFLRSDYVNPDNKDSLAPNIDSFFQHSLRFNNIYSPSGSTYRGNLSVFTATNPFFYNLDVKTFEALRSRTDFEYWRKIHTSQTSLAEYLQSAGYHTVMLNKGTRSGKRTMLDRGFNEYIQFPINMLIEDEIDQLFKVLDKSEEPFFIHLHAIPTRLHRAFYPYQRKRVENKNILYFPYQRDGKSYGYKVIRNHAAGTEQERQAEHLIYQQQLKYADEQLKRIFDHIQGIMDNTIVILVSTHGTQIGDKGVFASNGVSYESNIRVPLMIRVPGLSFSQPIDKRLSLLDFVPSILELAGLPHDYQDGSSLLSLGKPESTYKRTFIAGENDKDSYIIQNDWKLFLKKDIHRSLYRVNDGKKYGEDIYKHNKLIALNLETSVNQGFDLNIEKKTNNYIFIKTTSQRPELYNLREDPLEENNLAEIFPDITIKLTNLLDQYRYQAKSKIGLLPPGKLPVLH